MSSRNHVYVGPYFKAIARSRLITAVREQVCTNPNCKSKDSVSGKYCKECGSQIGSVEYTEFGLPDELSPFNVSEYINERMHSPGCNNGPIESGEGYNVHFWIPNITPKNPILPDGYTKRDFSVTEDEQSNQSIDIATVKNDCAYLASNFSKDFAMLKERYGEENVELDWGIITYMN
jgi:hypothetical protein